MLRTLALGAFLALFLQLQTASAMETDGAESLAEADTTLSEGQATPHEENDASERIYWDFITCVHTAHECKHEAEHHHFPHYKAVHDHHVCSGHASLACYGGHH